jgi:orotate phosphoribosyltransferase
MPGGLAAAINLASRLEGDFVLRSGQRSAYYFDKYRFEADPSLLKRVASAMLDLVPSDAEVLAGLELGGVPIATAMSLQSGLPVVFVRKEAKTYGTCRAVEGGELLGRCTVIVEDVISTGGAVADAALILRAEGARLSDVVCAIWRGSGQPSITGVPDLRVTPALTQSDLDAAR